MNLLKQNWIKVGLGILVLLNTLLFIRNGDFAMSNTALIIETALPSPSSSPSDEAIETSEVIDASKYASIMPVEPGTKWIYEGKRIWYDNELDPGLLGKAQESTGQKIIEIKSIKKDGSNLRVFVSTSYDNNPDDFDKFRQSFLLSESGFAFDGANLSYFPLVKGQRLSPSEPDLGFDDNYYVDYVSAVSIKNILGKKHRCYDILNYGLPDDTLDVFCEGVGYIRDSYTHHGTPDEWDYRLIRIEYPVLKK